uniref:WAP domain-containing protein n=1 Tax=Gouania willdenowi TaxID=441366 RepID=A0A8C5DBJ4_GOUWI
RHFNILYHLDKPGTCLHELFHSGSSNCHKWKKCNNDYDCPGKKKCCNTHCGDRCANFGMSPRSLFRHGLPHCHKWKKCDNENDCPRDEKCFNTRCGQRCTNLHEEKPGSCPLRESYLHHCDSVDKCNYDNDCSGDHKCCSFRCGNECAAPKAGDL